MTIHFVEPLAELRIGGLGAAIRSLQAALRDEWLQSEHVFIAEPKAPSIRERLGEFFATTKTKPEQPRAIAADVRTRFSWNVLAPRYAALYREFASTSS